MMCSYENNISLSLSTFLEILLLVTIPVKTHFTT